MANPTIRFKRGTQAAFASVGLNTGEPAFITDKSNFYIGLDGTNANNQFFGSARYWKKEDATNAAQLKLVDKDGTNSLSFQAPNALAGVGTFIFPNTTDGQAGDSLIITGVTNGVYTLEWANATAGAVSGISIRDEGTAALPAGAAGIGSVTTISIVGTGITASFSNPAAGIATVQVYTATTTQEGTASFASTNFNVNGGVVTLANSSTGAVLTVNGTTDEVEVSRTNGTVTVGLPDNVVVGTSLSSPTIRTNLIKSQDTNATAITITDNDVTIAGDLIVQGSTTQVNTTTLTIEDSLIELGKVDGAAPVSDLNKDLGLLLHWYDTAARLASVFWDDSTGRIAIASSVTESSGVLTVGSGQFANVEFKGLYISDTAGTAEEVISYTTIGGVTGRHLQNIIVDGGTF